MTEDEWKVALDDEECAHDATREELKNLQQKYDALLDAVVNGDNVLGIETKLLIRKLRSES